MVGLRTVSYAKTSLKMVKSRDMAGNAGEEEEEDPIVRSWISLHGLLLPGP